MKTLTGCLMLLTGSFSYNEALGIFYLFLLIAALVYLAKRRARYDEEHESDFSYLSVREQLAVANRTADTIAEAEQLITDMQESDESDVLVLHIEWLGRDDKMHEMSIDCNGINTATECMIEISDREINMLKTELAHQCAILSERGRHRIICRKNIEYSAGEGSADIDEIVHTMRSNYLNG